MNWKGCMLAGLLLFFLAIAGKAQADWELRTDKEGIKVYVKNIDNSPLKAVKTVCTVNASLTRLTAVLLDIKGSANWVYSTKSIRVLKEISPAELIYYSEIDVPWPANNRDFIVLLKVTQEDKSKVVSVIGYNKPDYLPENKNIVRIKKSNSKWLITPMQNGQLKIEYVLEVDPGGNVPAFLINMFAAKGPYETFRKLRDQLRKPQYNNISYPFIKD